MLEPTEQTSLGHPFMTLTLSSAKSDIGIVICQMKQLINMLMILKHSEQMSHLKMI